METAEITIVKSFIAAINRADAWRLSDLMAENHRFVDSRGTTVTGREKMRQGWIEYFRMFPDYLIEAEIILQDVNLLAIFGSASGTYCGKRGPLPENRIQMPAAWKAEVKNGRISLWQVYADWTEGMKIIEAEQKRD